MEDAKKMLTENNDVANEKLTGNGGVANEKLTKHQLKCSFCEKTYKHRSSLSRHKKICDKNPDGELITINKKKLEDLISLTNKLQKENTELKNTTNKFDELIAYAKKLQKENDKLKKKTLAIV